jgi:RHS repeat-associated protein
VGYTYGTANGLNDVISRLDALKQGTLTLESYKYLGLSTVIERVQPQVRLTYLLQGVETVGDAGDKYKGLDRFGRVVDQRWINNGGTNVDRYQYGYDRNSNVTSKTNVNSTNSTETYTYDGLNRLTGTNRAFGTAHDQSFDLDAAGNMTGVTTDGVLVNRTSNSQNQLTEIDGNSLTYDANGNLATDDQGRSYTFDTWNRLVAVNGTDGALIKAYAYDGTGRRIQEVVLDGSHNPVTTDLYFSSSWQVLEEYVGGQRTESNVYSPVYVNAIIARDKDTDGNGSLDQKVYFGQDANFNTTLMVSATGGTLGHFVYQAYGEKEKTDGNWSVQGSDTLGVKNTYQGGREDLATGLINFQRRDYNPRTYTWNSADPLGNPDGPSRYGFVANNPINRVDPTGRYSIESDGPYFDWRGV